MRRKILSLLLMLAVLVLMPLSAFADSSVTYTGESTAFTISPGSEYYASDLFLSFKDVMPGDTLTQSIEVKNTSDEPRGVTVYLRAYGAETGSEELLSQMTLRVQQTGGATLFDAPADQTAGLNDWVSLGTLQKGEAATLLVTLEVPITMGNDFQSDLGKLDWAFRVEEVPEPTPELTPAPTPVPVPQFEAIDDQNVPLAVFGWNGMYNQVGDCFE